jgi:gluconate 5-dehydrogenase
MPSGCLYKTNALFFHMTEFLSQRAAAADTNGKIRKPFYLKTMQKCLPHLFDLSDKIALITGSTDGLGNAIARGLGQAGATIIVNGRSSQAKLDDVVDDFRKKGINAFGYLCDVVDEQQVMEMIDWIEEKVGPLNILVNNAGVNVRSELINMSAVDFRRNVDVNLLGPFLVSKYAIRSMIRRRSGKIINICSMMSELGRDTVGAYAAAKGGLKMLTRNMATEWARHNIQVNGIGPGYFCHTINSTIACRWQSPE